MSEAQQKPFPTVTKDQVVELSKAVSIAKERLDCLGMMNTPKDAEKRVEAAAALRMAHDAWAYASGQYNRAFDAWARGGYQE